MSLFFNDSGGYKWTVTVDNSVTPPRFTATRGSITPVPAVYLNDVTNSTTWLIGITTAGVLTSTSQSFTNGYPVQIGVDVNYWMLVTNNGLLYPVGNLFPVAPTPKNGGPAWPVKKTPKFNTIIQTPRSLKGEVRITTTAYPVWMFEYNLEFLRGDFSSAQQASFLQSLVGFFGVVQGQFRDWYFNDPYDNACSGMQFGQGNGTQTQFQITRIIGGMIDLIQNLNGTPTVYVAGTPTTPNSISPTGLVTFSSAPAAGAALTWSGSFFFRCRFEEDDLQDLEEFMYQLWSLPTLKFRSVLL